MSSNRERIIIRPREKVTVTGQYIIIGPREKSFPDSVTLSKGSFAPPTPKVGQLWELVSKKSEVG